MRGDTVDNVASAPLACRAWRPKTWIETSRMTIREAGLTLNWRNAPREVLRRGKKAVTESRKNFRPAREGVVCVT